MSRPELKQSQSGKAQPARAAAPKVRLLIVDDHAVVRHVLAGAASMAEDIEVVGEAADGRSAIELARRLRPDVVLLDHYMPGMTGLETLRVLRGEQPHLKVIALSMLDDESLRAAMLRAGAAQYLDKDSPLPRILDAVRQASGPERASAA